MTGLVAGLVALWLAVGGYGLTQYGHGYVVYRGFPPPRDAPGVRKGHLETVTFYSRALHSVRSYDIYLPPGYRRAVRRGARFPVLYLLHGSPGHPRVLLNAGALGPAYDALLAHGRIRPFLIVLPNGQNGTWNSDTEWADTPSGQYESLVLDVVHTVDRHWATLPDRRDRAIGGYSEGAYGAANITLHHPQVFGIFESWSGYFGQWREGPFTNVPEQLILANSPKRYVPAEAARLRRYPLRVFLYGGTQDHEDRFIRPFARELRTAGATVTTATWPGGHDWALWRPHIPDMLRFADRSFARVASSSRAHGTMRLAASAQR
jgi:enterochelin esterase-like enzyme